MKHSRAIPAAALVAFLLAATPAAHDIPQSVTIHAFVKAEGDRLRVLLRAPLNAMRDIDFPERDGSLDAARSEPLLADAARLWILPELRAFEDDRELHSPEITAARLSLPSDRSFTAYASAIAHVRAPSMSQTSHLPRDQALLDVLIEYPIRSEDSRFSIVPAFGRLGVEVVTSLRFVTPGGVRPFELRGDPGLVRLDPEWHHAVAHFIRLGFVHILDGVDHLLFLACLVIPLRRVRPLVLVVTSFTAAHSIALVAAALGAAPDALWFPPLVETLIAASILYMAIENIVASPSVQRRSVLAFAFGLVHGFGFSFVLSETLQFAGSHLVVSLASFNLGVELGQLLVVAMLVPAVGLLVRAGVPERLGTIVLSVLVAHVAWHWMEDRWGAFREFPIPAPDAMTLAFLVRVLMVVVLLWAVAWGLRHRMSTPVSPQTGGGKVTEGR